MPFVAGFNNKIGIFGDFLGTDDDIRIKRSYL